MKAKLDENIPVRLAGELSTLRHDVHTVVSAGVPYKSGCNLLVRELRNPGVLRCMLDGDVASVPIRVNVE